MTDNSSSSIITVKNNNLILEKGFQLVFINQDNKIIESKSNLSKIVFEAMKPTVFESFRNKFQEVKPEYFKKAD